MKNNTIDAKLLNTRVAIDNALENAPIQTAVAVFGYDETKLLEGKALYERVQTLHNQQKKEYGEQYAATDELEAALRSASKDYMMHLRSHASPCERTGAQRRPCNCRVDEKKPMPGGFSRQRSFMTMLWPARR